MKVLITGGTGFIGSHLANKLILQGHDVTVFDTMYTGKNSVPEGVTFLRRSVLDTTSVRDAVKDCDIVFHLAGILGTSETINMILTTNEVNINGTVNVLESCRDYGIPMIFSSKPNPKEFINPYTISKVAAEQYCLMFNREFWTKVSIPRLMYLYGPGQGVYPDVMYRKYIPTFITNALQNRPLEIYGSGKQVIDPLFISDCVDALVMIMDDMTSDCKLNGRIYDVGSGIGYSVNEIAEVVKRLTKSKSPILHTCMRPGEPAHSEVVADITEVHTALGFTPKYSILFGIRDTIPYYKQLLK